MKIIYIKFERSFFQIAQTARIKGLRTTMTSFIMAKSSRNNACHEKLTVLSFNNLVV